MEKKEALFKIAAGLFTRNGFEATKTVQIARLAKATERMNYYHFKGKDDPFTQMLERASKEYISRLKLLPKNTTTQFDKIANLISLHFQFVRDMPNETSLIASTCPVRLNYPKSIYKEIADKQRFWLTDYLTACIKNGVRGVNSRAFLYQQQSTSSFHF